MAKKEDPLAEGQRSQAEAVKAQEDKDKVVPTPTQEEADKAKLGVLKGGFEAPAEPEEKAETAEKSGSYKTRAAKAE